MSGTIIYFSKFGKIGVNLFVSNYRVFQITGIYVNTRVALEMIHRNLSARAHTQIFF